MHARRWSEVLENSSTNHPYSKLQLSRAACAFQVCKSKSSHSSFVTHEPHLSAMRPKTLNRSKAKNRNVFADSKIQLQQLKTPYPEPATLCHVSLALATKTAFIYAVKIL